MQSVRNVDLNLNKMSEFSFSTINEFDAHINYSISSYNVLHNLVLNLSSYFINDDSLVVDLGCSTGLLLERLEKEYKAKKFIGIDKEPNIVKKRKNIEIQVRDITKGIKINNIDLCFSIFTLQFIEIEKRKKIIEDVYNSLSLGGAFIISEKIFMDSGLIQDIFSFCHYDFKFKNFTAKEILKKQKDLRKIMFPVNKKENEDMLKSKFKTVEPFFQSLNFIGWICIK